MCNDIEIFGLTVSMYWLSSFVGLIFATLLALFRRTNLRFHTSAGDIFFTILCCMIGAFIGAKVFQLTGYMIRDGANSSFWTFENWRGMLSGVGVFYGGLVGGIAGAAIYIRICKLDIWDVSDILVPSAPLFHAFGRLGCFFAGCCYGQETAWGIPFTNALNAPNGIPLMPVQLFEAGFNLLFLIIILIVRPERKRPKILLPLYLIVYAAGRFILEFFRGDIGRGVFLLSVSQWMSLLIIPGGIILLIWTIGKHGHSIEKTKFQKNMEV